MDEYNRQKTHTLHIIVMCIIITGIMIWLCCYYARTDVELNRKVKEEIIMVAKNHDFHVIEDWIDNITTLNSEIAIKPKDSEVYAYYSWGFLGFWSSSAMCFCSDGIYWRVGSGGKVNFMPYDNIKRNGSVSELPDQDDVQGALSELMSDKFQTLIRESRIAVSPPASITEQDIISIARKYGFEIVADKNEYKNWGDEKVKVVAKSLSSSGRVWFGPDFVIYEEGYILFPPDTIYRRKYSDYRKSNNVEKLEKLFSDHLSGSILERTVQAFREIVNL